jgi:hypothetical protein
MEIAYQLIGQDNMSHSNPAFFDDKSMKCDVCECVVAPYIFDRNIKLKKKGLDYSFTYEGGVVVSSRFKKFCQDREIENIIFAPLAQETDFFNLLVLSNPINVDVERSGIKMSSKCVQCGYYSQVFGGIDLYLCQPVPSGIGMYNTDIYWRSHYVFKQNIIVGIDTMTLLKKEKFKGLSFEKAYR